MKIALTLPGSPPLQNPVPSLKPEFQNLASLLNPIVNIIFYIAIFLAFFWLVWGAFAYIMAGGKKEDLAKARARITWALVGLSLTLLAFFVAKFAGEIFKPTTGGLPF